jgi:hypothetical protein
LTLNFVYYTIEGLAEMPNAKSKRQKVLNTFCTLHFTKAQRKQIITKEVVQKWQLKQKDKESEFV